MAKGIYYQCHLELDLDGIITKIISFIPARFAVKGKFLMLRRDGKWVNGWEVISVFEDSKTDSPPDRRKQIRGHRKMTGDSLP